MEDAGPQSVQIAVVVVGFYKKYEQDVSPQPQLAGAVHGCLR